MTREELICAVSMAMLSTIKPELPGVILGYDKDGDILNIFDEITQSLVSIGMPGICNAFQDGASVEEITADLTDAYFTLIASDALAHAFARHFPNVVLVKNHTTQ